MMKHLVSVCIPTLGREDKLARLVDLIPITAEWPHEIIVKYDNWPPDRKGCPLVLAECVAASRGEYVAFLGNDCLPEQGWLRIAMERLLKKFPDGVGLAGFNDLHWLAGEFATMWVASKQLLPMLDGFFFWPGYKHCGCDNELTERCRKIGKYTWCSKARVLHDHPFTPSGETDWSKYDKVYELAYNSVDQAHDIALLHERARTIGFALRENFTRPTAEEQAAAEDE